MTSLQYERNISDKLKCEKSSTKSNPCNYLVILREYSTIWALKWQELEINRTSNPRLISKFTDDTDVPASHNREASMRSRQTWLQNRKTEIQVKSFGVLRARLLISRVRKLLIYRIVLQWQTYFVRTTIKFVPRNFLWTLHGIIVEFYSYQLHLFELNFN